MDWNEAIEIFILYSNKQESTIKAYKKDIKHFMNHVKKPIEQVTELDVLRYLKMSKVSVLTKNRRLNALKTFFRTLSENGYLPINPAEKIKSFGKPKRIPHHVTLDEVESMLKHIKELYNEHVKPHYLRDYFLITLLFYCGLRISEALSIKKENFNLKEGLLTVIGKGNKQRQVPIPKKIMRELKKYLTNFEDNEHVFVNENRRPINPRTIQIRLKKYAKECGLDAKKITPHKLRHGYASYLLKKGIDIRIIQILLGHESIATTQVYTHIIAEDLKKKISNIF